MKNRKRLGGRPDNNRGAKSSHLLFDLDRKSKTPPCVANRETRLPLMLISCREVRARLVGLIGSGSSHPLRVEDEGFGFGFGALGWELFAIPEKTNAGGVADSDDEFTRGVEGSGGGRDQSFLAHELTVGLDGDPGSLGGADYQSQRLRWFLDRLGITGGEGANGDVRRFFGCNRWSL